MISFLLANSQRNAKISVAFGSALWGLYWIPLRALDGAGITGGWATLCFFLGSLVILLPVIALRWRRLRQGGLGLLITGAVGGFGMTLYADSLIMTEIVRAVLLFYLVPVWSTILARFMLGEPITLLRWCSIALGFAGLLTILGIDQGVPLPRGIGDWMALGSGMVWAYMSVRLRLDRKNEAEDLTLAYFIVGSVIAFAFTALPDGYTGGPPDATILLATLFWLVPALMLIVLPSIFLVIWGSRFLSPGLVSILFMTEISVATISAAVLADEPFGLREILGIILISSAGLLEGFRPAATRS